MYCLLSIICIISFREKNKNLQGKIFEKKTAVVKYNVNYFVYRKDISLCLEMFCKEYQVAHKSKTPHNPLV